MRRSQSGQVNFSAIILLLGIVITSVWIWKRLSLDTQEYLIDQAIPIALLGAALVAVLVLSIRAVRRTRSRLRNRNDLLALFQAEQAREKKLEIAFLLIETNRYALKGIESVAPAMKELFTTTLTRALGEKQHRIRGMAASHLGVLQDRSVVPLLVKALEDDHAYVRSCAALGLGRLRALETRERLMAVMKDDWDQTVRSRAKEALDRMGS
ncbi:hypothetical protein W02_28130 [Nitrospira sp. KM1]|uniref:HEAT repeat domain-containing protein n=1 Tax=Nitrospira sp. KM1 TaxID=1936990 RepID=UPI0013A71C51|nr:HEAT repeat domain-containing protein [Nitrospira sp. KM1]BCA55673.1 hypothetical protein W02_28130 [Nitrospira sp. KM1]